MNLLVLGGTGFLGYHVVAAALNEGHEVSVFTRGGDSPTPEVEMLRGDRYGDLSALRGREWDAVLDTFSDPDPVSETAKLFSGSAGAYGFVSGITNYHPNGPRIVSEDSPLRVAGEASPDDPLQDRGLAKLGCESAVLENFAGHTFIVRPGIMVGPRDPTDRFSWWPARMYRALARGDEEILAPGNPSRPVQFTDARDLALWMTRMLHDLAVKSTVSSGSRDEIYNAVGPGRREEISTVLEASLQAAEEFHSHAGDPRRTVSPRFIWAEEDFLEQRLSDLPEEQRPLWFPEYQIPFDEVDSSRAVETGLSFRPALDTARDTLRWLGSRADDPDGNLVAGLTSERERDLIQNWKGRRP